jgi:hypothetical protein
LFVDSLGVAREVETQTEEDRAITAHRDDLSSHGDLHGYQRKCYDCLDGEERNLQEESRADSG